MTETTADPTDPPPRMMARLTDTLERFGRGLVDAATAGHARAAMILAVLALLCFAPGQFAIPPTDRDESRFAQATKQMLETGNYIDIRLQDDARHKKPVGIYWLQAVAVTLSGQGVEAPIGVYRLPSLLGAVGGVLLTYWALFPLIGRRAAFLAGALTAATILLGVEARIAKTDAALFLCTVAAMGALVRAFLDPLSTRASRTTWLIFWVSVGVGALIKGPITLMVAGLAAVALMIGDRSWRWILTLKPLPGALLALAITAPWFIAIALESGGAFFAASLGDDMLDKVGTSSNAHWGPPGYHTALFWIVAWPAAGFLAIALPWIVKNWRRREILVLLAWALPTWVVFEIVSTKLPHYVLPAYPALFGVAALALVEGVKEAGKLWQRVLIAGLWLFPLILIVVGFVGIAWLDQRIGVPLLVVGVVTIAFAFVAAQVAARAPASAVPLAALVTAGLSLAIHQFGIPEIRTVWLSERMAQAARAAATCPNPKLASAAYHEPSLIFLTRTDLVMANGTMAADFLAETGPGGCRLAFVDAAPRRSGTDAEEADFRRRASQLGLQVEQVGMVEGRSVNGGHVRRMGLWRVKQPG